MFDEFDTTRVAGPRLAVQFDNDGTWSAWRGAILSTAARFPASGAAQEPATAGGGRRKGPGRGPSPLRP